MLMNEFIERTGFEPTAEEYAEIEEKYYNFDGDKDAFCKEFSKNSFSEMLKLRKEKIEKLQSDLLEQDKAFRAETRKMEQEIKRLQSDLDKELEWKPCTTAGTTLKQADYEKLESFGRVLTNEEAKQIIYDEFGFAPDKVTIIHTVSAYEVNKYHQLRTAETFERKAVYDASDYNYIRFDCANWFYEMVNGEIERYYC